MKILHIFYFIAAIWLYGCKKSEFLDKKPDDSLVVPTTLADIQALLDNADAMNGGDPVNFGTDPHLLESGVDDLYMSDARIFLLNPQQLLLYVWNDDFYIGPERFADWDLAYRTVYYSNVALDRLKNITPNAAEIAAYNNARGCALFARARIFYQLAQVYAPHYNHVSAENDLGVVLRLSSDINEKLVRASLAKTYQQIIADLTEAENLLPEKPVFRTRASRWSVYALLSRIFLTMGDYEKAIQNATKCLDIDNSLIDFSTVIPSSSSAAPFQAYNSEVIFHSINAKTNDQTATSAYVDTNLVKSYDNDDLRKSLFFRVRPNNEFSFRGAYLGTTLTYFTGLAIDEVYLVRAESYARTGNTALAMKDLNDLLVTRWKKIGTTSTYVDQTAATSTEALSKILVERRKELIGRGVRWTDLRRLNKEGANITIRRTLNGVEYSLLPNDPRYTYLIPPEVLAFNQAIIQNSR